MTVHELISVNQQQAFQQLMAIWPIVDDLARKAEIELPPIVFSRPEKRRSPGPLGYGALADQAYKERQLRLKFFNQDLFGEPAWDLLLDLFKHSTQQRQVSITSACIASSVPSTTALRWIGILLEQGLVTRTSDPADRRRAFLELTQTAATKLAQYFEAISLSRPPC